MNNRPDRFSHFALVVLLAFSATLESKEQKTPQSLFLSQTSGGCGLSLFADGSGRLSFGAAPQVVRVAPYTFDFKTIHRTARSQALPKRADARGDSEPARVVFQESSVVWYLNDTAWVRRLLEQGWASRLPPRAGLGEEDAHRVIGRTCDFQ